MKSVSRIALGVALVLGGASVVATAPADAQKKKKGDAAPAASGITLTKEERAAMAPVQTAIQAKDWAAAQAGLPAAAAAATSPGGRYAIGRFQLEVGRADLAAGDQVVEALGLQCDVIGPEADL